MGHKKRTPQKSSKSSPAAPRAEDIGFDGLSIVCDVQNSDSHQVKNKIESDSDYSAVKLECERALTALRRGNHTKAIRLMKESSNRHETSALIYRVQGTVCVKVATIMDDPNAKQRHLKNAILSARKASELAPNSIEFGHFYANLLYEAANEGREYEEVVQECERALSIENPIDPAKESLQDENQQKILTADARIEHVQNELRSLIQKANISSISTWMKNLGNGEDKFRLIPIRRPAEDPMEVSLAQTKRPNEIKKATKTDEERRKEVEVQVAAARLLQQKAELPQSQNDKDVVNGSIDSSSVNSQKLGKRRKYGSNRKNVNSAESKDFVRSYWNSISMDMKKDLLKIQIYDLKAYFSSLKDDLANEVLSEALFFVKANKRWDFLMCCQCSEKFLNIETHMQHLMQEHTRNLSPILESILPQNVDNEWIDMILNCSWKPLDLPDAFKMIKTKSKHHQYSEFGNALDFENHQEDCDDDCFKDAWDSSPEKEKNGDDNSCIRTIESMDCDKFTHDENQGSILYHQVNDWPLSDFLDRENVLEKIHSMLEVLIRHKYLAASHFTKVMQFTKDELQGLASGSQLLNNGVEQTPMFICFLGSTQLKKILKFLQEISHCCGLGRYPDKNTVSTIDDIVNGSTLGSELKEKIVFNDDESCLQLDEQLLLTEPNSDTLLTWIYTCPVIGEQLVSWVRSREDKIHQGVETLQLLEKEFYELQTLCEKKNEYLSYEKALQVVEDLCIENGKKRENENITEFADRSYGSVLRKRREDLIESENDIMLISNRFELDAISSVLKDADNLKANQYGFEDSYTSVTTAHLCHLESGEVDDWAIKDYSPQVNTCIEVAIQRQKDNLSVELSKTDANIMRVLTGMHVLERKFEPISSHDYRKILFPLVKIFLQAHLEDMAEKAATEKSDAAREAFLAELARDSKHEKEKAMDKKKNKEYRKNKESKVAEQYTLPNGTPAPIKDIDSEVVVSVNGDDLKELEFEFKRKIELEEEERKLEETLEYQRRIENEAKQRHLAEQHKKLSRTVSEKVDEELPNGYSKTDTDDQDLHEQLHMYRPDLPSQQNGHLDNDMPMHKFEGAALPGIPNGEILEEGGFPSDRRAGKRGKKQKNPMKQLDWKNQTLSTAKENVAVGIADEQVNEKVVNDTRDNEAKRQIEIQVVDDDEQFNADLEKAYRQSLDTLEAHKKFSLGSSLKMKPNFSLETKELADLSSHVTATNDATEADLFGTGLKNEVGEYNCFLNVIIQSLWHVRKFRDEFLKRPISEHAHIGDPCVVCALYDIFTALSVSSTDTRREAVAPTSLRIALSNLYPNSNFFQEAQMNDASEVLEVIFTCLHQSHTSNSAAPDTASVESNGIGSWDCASNGCMSHSLFGLDISEQMNCYSCGFESRHFKYSSFFHNINASALRTMKVMCAESSFDELLSLVEMNHQLACDTETGGCGKLNHIHHFLNTSPHVFTTVLGWQNTCESAEDITATLAALTTEIDVGVLYRGIHPENRHLLVSVVCYYGQHYHCFAYSHEHERWIMYDDTTVKVIGGWDDVLRMCEKGHLQPQVLFFEAVN